MDTLREQIDVMRAGRVLADLTQTELAAAAGISRQMVARLENRSGNVPVKVIGAVRAALEGAGIVFLPSTATRGISISRTRRATATGKLASPEDRQKNEVANPSEEPACPRPSQSSTPSSGTEIPS
ncbi:helix-turn-helix transcriptional regulator [Agrobacterium rubi]|nr:helix-turn-helix transcriptional regulator [Agrobacterium rubi]NTF24503.1 helix-turn-helix transcriptional regulator [Agrobacterium rubi]